MTKYEKLNILNGTIALHDNSYYILIFVIAGI